MKMIATLGAAPIDDYAAYVHNCQRNAACEPPWAAPLPGVPYLQLYVDFGAYKPATYELWLQDVCDPSHTEQLFASNYIVGKTPDGNWYGVFKYITHPLVPVTGFVAWLSVLVSAPGGLLEKTYFTELLQVETCLPLTKIKACYPEGATDTGFDLLGLYYGRQVNADFLGFDGIRYFHIAYTRLTKARELPPKATFTSNLIRTFRSSVDRTWSLETELVPRWYYVELLAIYLRGALSLNDGPTYLVSDVNAEAINDDDLTWKPFATLKQTTRQFFGCDTSVCVECCSPQVLGAVVNTTGFVPCFTCCTPVINGVSQQVVDESASASASTSASASGSESESASASASASASPSASAGPDEDAQAYIDAAVVDDLQVQDAIFAIVADLKDAGIWAKLRAAWLMIEAYGSGVQGLNLTDPRDLDAAFRLSFHGGWTHGAGGALPNGTTAYADSHLDPSVVFPDELGGMGYYSRTAAANMVVDMGTYDSATATQLSCRYAGNIFYGNWGTSGVFPSAASASGQGLFCVNRNNNVSTQGYVDGLLVFDTADIVIHPTLTIYVGARHGNAGAELFTDKECAFAFVANGLTAPEQLALYNAVQTFQGALGRDV